MITASKSLTSIFPAGKSHQFEVVTTSIERGGLSTKSTTQTMSIKFSKYAICLDLDDEP